MSQSNSVPGATEKVTTDDDKFLESTNTDSGFISGSNLTYSGEILSEEEGEEKPSNLSYFKDSGAIEADEEEKGGMYVDSGVDCLSQSLSGLNIENSGKNDLSSGKIHKPVECKQVRQADIPWQIYYEQDEDGHTHLHMAIIQGVVDIIHGLIRSVPHPQLLDTPNDEAITALHLAVVTKQPRVVRWLISAGAKPGCRNLGGDSPLHLASSLGDIDCCKAILDPISQEEKNKLGLTYETSHRPKMDLEQWNYEGQTSVHVAALNGNTEVLRYLVKQGANVNAREGKSGYTALHYAIQNQDEKLAYFLLNECDKLNVGVTTYCGQSPLELGYPVKSPLYDALRSHGVDTPQMSEDEDSEDDSDSQIYFGDSNKYMGALVNASA